MYSSATDWHRITICRKIGQCQLCNGRFLIPHVCSEKLLDSHSAFRILVHLLFSKVLTYTCLPALLPTDSEKLLPAFPPCSDKMFSSVVKNLICIFYVSHLVVILLIVMFLAYVQRSLYMYWIVHTNKFSLLTYCIFLFHWWLLPSSSQQPPPPSPPQTLLVYKSRYTVMEMEQPTAAQAAAATIASIKALAGCPPAEWRNISSIIIRGGRSANDFRYALFRYEARQGKWEVPAFLRRYQTVSALTLAHQEYRKVDLTVLPLWAIEKRERGREWGEERMKSVIIRCVIIHPCLHPLLCHWGWVTATCLACWCWQGGGGRGWINPTPISPSPAPLGLGDRHLHGLLVLAWGGGGREVD
jgi:hypothetical protein